MIRTESTAAPHRPGAGGVRRRRPGGLAAFAAAAAMLAMCPQGAPGQLVLAPPELTSPPDGAAGQPLDVTLRWSEAAGATSYDVQVSADPEFGTTFADASGLSGTTFSVAGLSPGASYHWRVRAAALFLESAWSDSWSFTTGAGPPGIPRLLSPANGATGVTVEATLIWEAVSGAERYHLQVGYAPAFDPMPIDSAVPVTSYRAEGLPGNTSLVWRVRARVDGTWGNFSPSWTLTTARPPARTLTLQAVMPFPVYDSPSDYAPTDYRLAGIPGAAGRPVADFLTGDPGVGWQMYFDNGNPSDYLVKYDGGMEFRFTAGRAFWLIHRGPWNLSAQVPAAPLNANGEVEIPLRSGWNVLTNPLTDPVAWGDVEAANGFTGPLYGFDGGFAVASAMEPYAGYYFFNAEGMEVLRIPAGGAAAAGAAAAGSVPGAEEGWMVQVEMVSGRSTDRTVRFGCRPAASEGLDRFDARKPRAISASVPGVWFERPRWDSLSPHFAADIRPEISGIAVWPFAAHLDPGGEARLTFRGIAGIPSFFQAWLLDDTRGTAADLRTDSVYTAVAPSGLLRGRIAVGDADEVGDLLRSLDAPEGSTLGGNYPNPFNPSTFIPVTLTAASELTLTVHDVIGREVRTLFAGRLERGRYLFAWDGLDERGRPASSGVYFSRLRSAGGIHVVRRMLKMQ